ncbi:MAG TPA: NAD-dependent epimerase/dehydratase family protein [Stellaceae bacterium]|nr:NAD-dependent epimerase/dehydratase family protein [Stellaceae bacterium]
MKDARVFITGGSGFVGSRLAMSLIADNRVAVFDNFSRDALSSSGILSNPNLQVVSGDVCDHGALAAAMAEFAPTHVVHSAAIAGIDTVVEKPVNTLSVNLIGTANLLSAALDHPQLRRAVIFSTSEVFGQYAFANSEESSTSIGAAGEARWLYAVSKLASEHLAIAYHRQHGMPTVVLRPFNVYGPGQIGESAMVKFIHQALRGRPLEIHGDGTQIRAWCYVDDMIRALLAALEHPRAVGETFNIGNPRAVTTIYGLASTVVRLLRSPSEIAFAPRLSADVELRVPNANKAREHLGFEAKVDLEEGIPRTAEFYRERLEWDTASIPSRLDA